ncbi:MAG: hypothetical protein DRH04_00235 [Deltaproteobacteria bacterium]|nr:MAG: hypothetical protein DRH04_00235 [Deltaproteobacteria bacterium]
MLGADEFKKLEPKQKKKIITAFIDLLQGTGMVIIGQPYLYQELCRRLCLATDYQEFRLYLNVLLDDRNERWFKEGLESESGKGREEEIRKIVFDNDQKTVRENLAEDEICLEKVRRWFLQIYDLDSLARLEKGVKSALPRVSSPIARLKEWSARSSTLLRLIGCILAGYFAVSSQDFLGAVTLPAGGGLLAWVGESIKLVLHWAILGYFTYLYIFREIRNRLKVNFDRAENLEKASRLRARKLFIRAVIYSLVIGLLMSFFIWPKILETVTPGEGRFRLQFFLWCFPVYLQVILYQAPLAMFIGIFINLLWEDKGLTEPL